jgi:hypothetical protein
MDIRSVFPSKYIRAADLKGQDVRVVIGQYIPSGYDNCRKKLGDSMVAVIICSVRG